MQTAAYLEDEVQEELDGFEQRRVFEPITGCGIVLTARMLAEIGDDPARFPQPSNLRAYAGTSPGTRQSGKARGVHLRLARNRRLTTSVYQWAAMAILHSRAARAHYDRRRAAGDRHAAALRNLGNKMLGCLHHCLRTGEPWDERKVWPLRVVVDAEPRTA